MKTTKFKRATSFVLATAIAITTVLTSVTTLYAGDSLPLTGESAIKTNQPYYRGYRAMDIANWSPAEDPNSEYLRARVPLQKRNDAFKPTQANPELDSKVQIMLMQGDYGNAFLDSTMYNNTFGYYTLNYWQYADFYAPWHGAATPNVPMSDKMFAGTDGAKAYFEFGSVSIPNPAYTNAAHKNGVQSIAVIYFDQTFRPGQTVREILKKDEKGNFVVADKLIEMAKYYGYDGYFFNHEEKAIDPSELKEFLLCLENAGLYTQFYDNNSTLDEDKAQWLSSEVGGSTKKIQDSVFLNYFWNGSIDETKNYAQSNNIDMYKQVFFGVEANQGKFNGSNSTTNIPILYESGTKNPIASLALFSASDYYHRGLSDDLGLSATTLVDPDYQWMIAERERMYFSGVKQDPTDTGVQAGFSYPEVGLQNAGSWVGVADFTSERSVINGSKFYTNFNTGKGMQYFTNGAVSRDEEWTNITVQDILPSWQWWIDTPNKTDTKLKADFDYGDKYYTGATNFTHVGAFNGGSSLVVTGDLSVKNNLHLYKTDLDVKANSKINLTFNKPSVTDASQMSLVVYLKDDPTNPVFLPIEHSNQKTSGWVSKSVDLSAFSGKKIAALGLSFEAKQGAISNYQMNIGEIKLTDGENYTPAKPTGFKVNKAFSDNEMVLTWDIADFNNVDKYEIFATLSDGSKIYVGSIYDSIYYVKSLLDEKKAVSLELYAIGKDGSKSEPATIDYNYNKTVSNLTAKTALNKTGLIMQNEKAGYVDLTWNNPDVDYKELQINVKLSESNDTYSVSYTVPKGTTSASVPFGKYDGERYLASVTPVLNDGTKLDTMSVSGYTKDVTAGTYSKDKLQFTNSPSVKYLNFWGPDSKDWYKLHVKVNGVTPKFSGPLGLRENLSYIERGCTFAQYVIKPDDNDIEVVVEDYSGNLSKPMHFYTYADPNQEITSAEIPDEVLLNAIKEQIGSTKQAITEYAGKLDLTNLNITDYTGLNLLKSTKEINLTGSNLETISKDLLPIGIEKVVLDNSKNLKIIGTGALSNCINANTISIVGCDKLAVISLSDTTLEKIIYGDVNTFKDLKSLDLSNSKFDMTEGTNERNLADVVNKQAEGESNIVIADENKTNLALNAVPIPEATNLNTKYVNILFDGQKSMQNVTYKVTLPGYVTIKLDSPQKITSWKLTNGVDFMSGDAVGFKDFVVEYSNDGTNWSTLGTAVTDNELEIVSQDIANPVDATYYRLTVSKVLYIGKVKEFELFGNKQVIYTAGAKYDGQTPNIYYSYPESVTIKSGTDNIDPFDFVNATTVNNTKLDTLKSATFLAESFDVDAKKIPNNVVALITNNAKATFMSVPTDKADTYTIVYTKYDLDNPTGYVQGQTTVTVEKDTTVDPIDPPQNPDEKPTVSPSTGVFETNYMILFSFILLGGLISLSVLVSTIFYTRKKQK